MADIVLPATMFTEHDDLYKGGGHQHVLIGPKLVDAPGECRENHWVNSEIAKRVGAEHPGFAMTAREHVDWLVEASGLDGEALWRDGFIDLQPPFEEAHFLNGFGYLDGKFRFSPDWATVPDGRGVPMGPFAAMPKFPDQWDVIEAPTGAEPYRLVTAPARSFLNSTFNETDGSRRKEGVPMALIHPLDAAAEGIEDGAEVTLANRRGAVTLTARLFEGVQRGTVVSEGLFRNADFVGGRGINTLTGADPVAPYGGAAFHDNRVSLRPAAAG